MRWLPGDETRPGDHRHRRRVGTECFAASSHTPVLQEPVHVDVGEQRARDAALLRAALIALAADDSPLPVAIPFVDWRPKLSIGAQA